MGDQAIMFKTNFRSPLYDPDGTWNSNQVSRIYCVTDYYDVDGNLVKRPDCVTKAYDSLMRYVKKLAPYTEVEYHPANPCYDKVKSKIYITPQCLALVCEQDYGLH